MKRRDFFKFIPASAAGIAATAVLGKPINQESRKVPVYLRPQPKPYGAITVASIQGETVMVDLDEPLEKQFSGEYLDRVRRELGREYAYRVRRDLGV